MFLSIEPVEFFHQFGFFVEKNRIFATLIKINKEGRKTMEYSIIIEKNPTTGVYIGQCSQIPEAMSQGNTLAELMTNMKEAIELAIECRRVELKDLYKNRKIFHRRLTVNA